MNVNKKTLIFVSFVAAVTTGVMLYYAGDKENIKEERQVLLPETDIEEEIPVPETESYMVYLEDGKVTLYHLQGDAKNPVESLVIDESYYPEEDIKALTQGISAYTVEEGYGILENFAN